MASYTVALTGASGSIYGVRLIGELLRGGSDVDLIVSPSALLVMEHELSATIGSDGNEVNFDKFFLELVKKHTSGNLTGTLTEGSLTLHDYNNIASKLASGSYRKNSSQKKNMVVVPCSMGTLARIATGMSSNLIERAADCVIKESGNLVLVPRETPLSAIHLENMLKLSRLGIKIIPAMPGFYNKPKTIDDMVNFVIGKVLDSLGIENNLFKRWNP